MTGTHSGSSSTWKPGLPPNTANEGTTVLGVMNVLSSMRQQSLRIAKLPYKLRIL